MSELFLNAARKKYRYPYNGQIMTEDLFDLDLRQLDMIYKSMARQVRDTSEDSLLDTTSAAEKELREKMEIVRYVFQYKEDMAKRAEKAAETRARKQKIMDLIREKEDGSLAEKSIQELKEELEALDVT